MIDKYDMKGKIIFEKYTQKNFICPRNFFFARRKIQMWFVFPHHNISISKVDRGGLPAVTCYLYDVKS